MAPDSNCRNTNSVNSKHSKQNLICTQLGKLAEEVYSPPRRRESEAYEHLDERSVEFIRKALRGQFRRSENSIIKLEERLIKMGCKSIDSEEEEKRKITMKTSKEDDMVEDCASGKIQNQESTAYCGKPDNRKNEDTQAQARGQDEDGQHFNLTVRNMHSMTMNRKLSLIENVQKNYGKYIRPPTETVTRPVTSPVPQSMSAQFIIPEAGELRPRSQGNPRLDKDQFVNRSNLGLRNERNYNSMNLERFEQEDRNLLSSPDDILFHRLRSKSNSDINEDLKKQRRLITNSAAKRTTERWKKLSVLVLRRKKEADGRRRQIQDIHRQVTLNQRPKFQSVSLPSLMIQPSQRNEEFYEEMRIISEALQAINVRLDERLKVLNGGSTSRPPSKKLLKLPKIERKG